MAVMVWVTYRCRRRLFDRLALALRSWLPILLYSVVLCSVPLMIILSLVPPCVSLRTPGLQVMPLQTDPGNGPGPRKITFMWVCNRMGLICWLQTLLLLSSTWFAIPVMGTALPTWPR